MNHKSITPNPQQPVDRVPTGQLPSALAELSEEAISSLGVDAAYLGPVPGLCSYVEAAYYLAPDACSYDDGNE